jgi:Mg2+ and Co2+ transporter CorA
LVQSLFERTTKQLGNDALYRDVREEVRDMSEYLDSDAQRRQSGSMMRLTVVTTFGLIGTVATGFLGMNLIAAADAPLPTRIGAFALVMSGAALLTLFAVARSARLAELLEIVADEKVSAADKLAAFWRVFQRKNAGV